MRSEAGGSSERQALSALLDHIREVCDAECARIRDETDAEVARLLREARDEAHPRVRAAIEEARYERARILQDAYARRDTRLRERRHRLGWHLLEELGAKLTEAMAECWQREPERRRWIAVAVRRAREYLPAGAWRIEHPRDCDAAELAALVDEVADERDAYRIEYAADPALRAGIRVHAGEALLDAGDEAILARSAWTQGLLLGELQRLRRRQDAGGPETPGS